MTEFDVVMRCKEGHKPSLQALYFKYAPFIAKHYHKMQKQFYYKIPIEKEDFEASGYEALVKAVGYVDPNKVTNREKWLFIGVFGYYLNMLRNQFITEYIHQQANEIPLYLPSHDGEEYCVADVIHPSEAPNLLRDVEEEIFVTSLMSNLDDFEKTIFRKRMEVREKGKPRSLQSIAEELGCSFSKVQSSNKKIERIYQSMKSITN